MTVARLLVESAHSSLAQGCRESRKCLLEPSDIEIYRAVLELAVGTEPVEVETESKCKLFADFVFRAPGGELLCTVKPGKRRGKYLVSVPVLSSPLRSWLASKVEL